MLLIIGIPAKTEDFFIHLGPIADGFSAYVARFVIQCVIYDVGMSC